MRTYINKRTGAVIQTESIIGGDLWEPAKKQPKADKPKGGEAPEPPQAPEGADEA